MDSGWSRIDTTDSVWGKVGVGYKAIKCPNKECNQLNLRVRFSLSSDFNIELKSGIIQDWQLLPESSAKVLPDYVPTAIQKSYKQACRIRDLSPEASATLARRALQGMIRDFWGISKNTLKEEIDAIEEKVDPDTWESIEAVRSVGNIGAHMEKDINTIVEIEPDEAQLLLELIESLIDDWYVTREKRKERNAKVAVLAKEKNEARKGPKQEGDNQ